MGNRPAYSTTAFSRRPAGPARPSRRRRPRCTPGAGGPPRTPRRPRRSGPQPGRARCSATLAGAGQAPQQAGGERRGSGSRGKAAGQVVGGGAGANECDHRAQAHRFRPVRRSLQSAWRVGSALLEVLLSGTNIIHGFRNADIRSRLADTVFLKSCGHCVAKQSAKVSRLLNRFHIYGSSAKIPRTRRWRLTKKGWTLFGAAIALKEQAFPALHAQTAA